MKTHPSILGLLTPALCAGVLSVATLHFGLSSHGLPTAGLATPVAPQQLHDVRYSVPTASTVVIAAAAEMAVDYAVEETYVAEAAAWVYEQIGE